MDTLNRPDNSRLHRSLVEVGAKWAKNQGFPIIGMELSAQYCREQPDVIAFRATCSVLIEVKCSRADFLADRKKPERAAGLPTKGLGVYRFYLCPTGLLQVDDVPASWGLLWADRGRVQLVKGPLGNAWPPYAPDHAVRNPGSSWAAFMHEPDFRAERAVMFSIARRLANARALREDRALATSV